jgi:hypothetical protein
MTESFAGLKANILSKQQLGFRKGSLPNLIDGVADKIINDQRRLQNRFSSFRPQTNFRGNINVDGTPGKPSLQSLFTQAELRTHLASTHDAAKLGKEHFLRANYEKSKPSSLRTTQQQNPANKALKGERSVELFRDVSKEIFDPKKVKLV